MPRKLDQWLERIKAVEREHSATRLATRRLLLAAQQDPTILIDSIRVRDIDMAVERLDGTYAVRLFAEFETGLRQFWIAIRGTEPPSAHDLLEGVAARRSIPIELLAHVHAVREYRNSLVHERDEPVDPIAIAIARGHLCRFLSFLPPNW